MTAARQLWAGRSSGQVSDIMVAMGESISLDIELYREDIRGSVAHARMLERIGILTAEERTSIENGLRRIKAEIESGSFNIDFALEDIHTHVETRLGELIGETARKLHTARSRNDQIAVDTHLFVRRCAAEIAGLVWQMCATLYERAASELDTILPGYTHLQIAQPVRLSHHLLAHFWSFIRDLERLDRAARAADRLPLGSGAMAGVNYATDREFLRTDLDFREIYSNSMDAVSTRDHILEFLHALSVCALRASRVAEEIIIWNSMEFGFIDLPDELTTGSSIMPQKKNPDLAELIRGKVGRVCSHYQNLSMNLKSLPLTYNRDLQEDRMPLLDADRQMRLILPALNAMLAGMRFRTERMRASLQKGHALATDLADALVVQKGLPFRDAHHLVGAAVARCEELGCTLPELPVDERENISPLLADDDFYGAALDLAASTDRKVSAGGTARTRQLEQLEQAGQALSQWKKHDWRFPPLDF